MQNGPGLLFIESLDLRGKRQLSSEVILRGVRSKSNAALKGGWVKDAFEFWELVEEWISLDLLWFPILYISAHGLPNGLKIGPEIVSYKELARRLKGKCRRRTIMISSCNSAKHHNIESLFAQTLAKTVVGYKSTFSIRQTAQDELTLIFKTLSKMDL